MRKYFALCFFALFSSLGAAPAQVIVIRHGEKTDDGISLATKGRERAMALVPYFMETTALLMYGQATAIFATKPDSVSPSTREIETITPLARALNLEVQTPFGDDEYPELVKAILANAEYEGKMVVICWDHLKIPGIAYDFGVNPQPVPYPIKRFDLVWVISFPSLGSPQLRVLNQELLFEDSFQPFHPFPMEKKSILKNSVRPKAKKHARAGLGK